MVENNSLELTRIFKESFKDQRWAWEKSVRAEKRDRDAEREKETFRRQRHHYWWWRWRRNVSFSLSASLSLFSALTLFSHAHLYSNFITDTSNCLAYWNSKLDSLSTVSKPSKMKKWKKNKKKNEMTWVHDMWGTNWPVFDKCSNSGGHWDMWCNALNVSFALCLSLCLSIIKQSWWKKSCTWNVSMEIDQKNLNFALNLKITIPKNKFGVGDGTRSLSWKLETNRTRNRFFFNQMKFVIKEVECTVLL